MNATRTESIAHSVWNSKYRLRRRGRAERDLDESWQRVARAIAAPESARSRSEWSKRFHTLLATGGFLPGGRIIAGAGSAARVTLLNCFVMGPIHDSINGIMRALREGALTMQQGGGVGFDFSTLRPRGSPARGSGASASGPVSFMEIWDATCRTLLGTGPRQGAMMATLRCDHPDIELFVDAKRRPDTLTRFNLSVLISDAFMDAVRADGEWRLTFPAPGEACARTFIPIRRTVQARALWDRIVRAAYDSAEPGVLFVDRINAENNLRWRERISATNPCGEVPLPPYGSCDLGSLNLVEFVRQPFDTGARLDHDGLARATRVAVRFLDNVIDVSRFPLRAQAMEARATRRLGLGLTGLADALLMLGLTYGSEAACECARAIMQTVCHAAYGTSAELAQERGTFGCFEREPYLDSPFIRRLPAHIRDLIARHGIRNSHLTAIAPAGSISLLAGGVSSGIEPVFAARYRRKLADAAGAPRLMEVEDPALRAWTATGRPGLPAGFVTAAQVDPLRQLAMQAALQEHVDGAISKTVTLAPEHDLDAFAGIYERAHAFGLKGCTVFRPGTFRGAVLDAEPVSRDSVHCSAPNRLPG